MESGGGGKVSVFSPTQIKSATDNIGTFDGSNEDIRYSSITPEEIIEESVELKKAVDGLRDDVQLLAADNARLARELTLTDGKTINVDEVRKPFVKGLT